MPVAVSRRAKSTRAAAKAASAAIAEHFAPQKRKSSGPQKRKGTGLTTKRTAPRKKPTASKRQRVADGPVCGSPAEMAATFKHVKTILKELPAKLKAAKPLKAYFAGHCCEDSTSDKLWAVVAPAKLKKDSPAVTLWGPHGKSLRVRYMPVAATKTTKQAIDAIVRTKKNQKDSYSESALCGSSFKDVLQVALDSL